MYLVSMCRADHEPPSPRTHTHTHTHTHTLFPAEYRYALAGAREAH